MSEPSKERPVVPEGESLLAMKLYGNRFKKKPPIKLQRSRKPDEFFTAGENPDWPDNAGASVLSGAPLLATEQVNLPTLLQLEGVDSSDTLLLCSFRSNTCHI